MPLKVKSALICDHARREDNGKHILIGVYSGDIILAKMPSTFMPTFWIEIVPFVQYGKMEIEIKMEAPGPRNVAKATANINVEKRQVACLPFRHPPRSRKQETLS